MDFHGFHGGLKLTSKEAETQILTHLFRVRMNASIIGNVASEGGKFTNIMRTQVTVSI